MSQFLIFQDYLQSLWPYLLVLLQEKMESRVLSTRNSNNCFLLCFIFFNVNAPFLVNLTVIVYIVH